MIISGGGGITGESRTIISGVQRGIGRTMVTDWFYAGHVLVMTSGPHSTINMLHAMLTFHDASC